MNLLRQKAIHGKNKNIKIMREEFKFGIKEANKLIDDFKKGDITFLQLTCGLWNGGYNACKEDQQKKIITSAFIELFDKAACIQHWHDSGKNNEGMVVSSKKVHQLWEVLEKYKQYRHSL